MHLLASASSMKLRYPNPSYLFDSLSNITCIKGSLYTIQKLKTHSRISGNDEDTRNGFEATDARKEKPDANTYTTKWGNEHFKGTNVDFLIILLKVLF